MGRLIWFGGCFFVWKFYEEKQRLEFKVGNAFSQRKERMQFLQRRKKEGSVCVCVKKEKTRRSDVSSYLRGVGVRRGRVGVHLQRSEMNRTVVFEAVLGPRARRPRRRWKWRRRIEVTHLETVAYLSWLCRYFILLSSRAAGRRGSNLDRQSGKQVDCRRRRDQSTRRINRLSISSFVLVCACRRRRFHRPPLTLLMMSARPHGWTSKSSLNQADGWMEDDFLPQNCAMLWVLSKNRGRQTTKLDWVHPWSSSFETQTSVGPSTTFTFVLLFLFLALNFTKVCCCCTLKRGGGGAALRVSVVQSRLRMCVCVCVCVSGGEQNRTERAKVCVIFRTAFRRIIHPYLDHYYWYSSDVGLISSLEKKL